MSATITWRVGTMECYPTYQQEKDVVFTVHWDCLGSETVSGSTYNGRVYGSTGVTYHSGSEFTPYNQLTQDQVLGWVWESMGTEQKNSYENSVQTQINNQINPPVVILPLPWTPPYISIQPIGGTFVTGSNVTLTVIPMILDGMTYQWKKNRTNIDQAVSSSYNISNIQPSDAGDYIVVVTSANGQSVTSNIATVTVINPTPTPTPPVITEQPSSQTIIVGDGAVFNVNALSEPPLSYQWFKNDVEIVGATGNTYIIQTSTLTDAGNYHAVVTNIVGSTTSDTATLTVNE